MKYYSDLDSTAYAIRCALPREDFGDIPNLYAVSDFQFFPSPQIYIDDPLNSSNNVGKSSYQFQQIKVSDQT